MPLYFDLANGSIAMGIGWNDRLRITLVEFLRSRRTDWCYDIQVGAQVGAWSCIPASAWGENSAAAETPATE